MTDDVLERMISSFMATDQPVYTFGWQGGEPTLMGVDFYRKAVELQKKYGRRGCHVANGLQTNGTLINDELASLFAEYSFLLGVSLDGPLDIHDSYRLTRGGGGSHNDVLRGIDALRRNKVEFNILTLVNNINGRRGRDVYNYLKDMGINYHQYIPCVEFDGIGKLLPYAIDGEVWGNFLCEVFDEWVKNDIYKISIRLFDGILGLMVNGSYSICHMAGNCCQYFVVEHNGDVYPCDFFVMKDKRLGSIMESTWSELLTNPLYIEFGALKNNWDPACSGCEYLNYCSGDCLKHRIPQPGSNCDISRLCSGWKKFFAHTLPWFEEEARKLQRQRQLQSKGSDPRDFVLCPSFNIGRNDPCFCGSNKKYKKCHGAGR